MIMKEIKVDRSFSHRERLLNYSTPILYFSIQLISPQFGILILSLRLAPVMSGFVTEFISNADSFTCGSKPMIGVHVRLPPLTLVIEVEIGISQHNIRIVFPSCSSGIQSFPSKKYLRNRSCASHDDP